MSWQPLYLYVLGGLFVALASVTLWANKRLALPVWAKPLGWVLMAYGLFVVPVEAHPTTYVKNPVPFQTTVVQRGAALFQTHRTSAMVQKAAAMVPRPPASIRPLSI